MGDRVQLSRAKGWRLPSGAVSVARPTRWGNPFAVGARLGFPFDEVFGPVVRDRAHAVEIFASYARITPGYELLVRRDLFGKSLACWCPLTGPCHADVLLEICQGKRPAGRRPPVPGNWAPCASCPHLPDSHAAVIIRPIAIDPPCRVLFEGTLGGCQDPGCECAMYARADLKEAPRG